MNKFTFSVPVQEECGKIKIKVAKEDFEVQIATVKLENLYLDPENPRLWEGQCKDPNLSKAGQDRIMSALLQNELKDAAERLTASFEYHGGQNEEIWVQYRNGKAVVVEGNRRMAVAKKTKSLTAMLCHILPDEMENDYVAQLLARRHLAEHERWPSVVQAEYAYKFMIGEIGGVEGKTYEERMENICSLMNFDSIKSAEKYIHSFLWWRESKLGSEHWSKFNHAYVPRLIKYFGYDKNHIQDNSAPFKDKLRRSPVKNDELTLLSLDAKIKETSKDKSCKVGFEWFVDLIKNGHLTDCRHSDALLSPILAHAAEGYADQVFEILQQKPTPKGESPSQRAFSYFQTAKRESTSGFQQQIEKTTEVISDMNKPSKLKYLKRDNDDNRCLLASLEGLQAHLTRLINKMKVTEKVAV